MKFREVIREYEDIFETNSKLQGEPVIVCIYVLSALDPVFDLRIEKEFCGAWNRYPSYLSEYNLLDFQFNIDDTYTVYLEKPDPDEEMR